MDNWPVDLAISCLAIFFSWWGIGGSSFGDYNVFVVSMSVNVLATVYTVVRLASMT